MRVVSVKIPVKTGVSSLMRIGLSDGSLFSFNAVYLPPDFSLDARAVPGAEISADEAALLRFAAGCYRAERAALALIARAEQTRSGLKGKLEHKGMDAAYTAAALDYLEKTGIINDGRFAELWLESKLRQVRGHTGAGRGGKLCPRKLLASLLGRFVPPGIARKAVAAALDAETERGLLNSYLAGNFPNFDKDDFHVKLRLKAAGFSSAVIRAYWEDI
jgi:regulatory protein